MSTHSATEKQDPETNKLSVSCHCGDNRYEFIVTRQDLPFRPLLCSCNVSRRISGVLCTAYVPVPKGNAAPKLDRLTAYESSSILKRWFCTTCGSHAFLEYSDDGHWEVAAGLLEGGLYEEQLVQYQGHMWIEDTKDGGASIWIQDLQGKSSHRFARGAHESEQLPLNWSLSTPFDSKTSESLQAHCHCGTVKYFITRPTTSPERFQYDYPDLLIPYHSDTANDNLNSDTWWISQDQNRYLAGHCACNSCRTLCGFDIQQWAFIPRSNIHVGNDHLRQGRLLPGTKRYDSSPGVTRTFCATCGANVFWESEKRPGLIDAAVGLLYAESGARAEEWLEWVTSRVSFCEESHNTALMKALEGGLKGWHEC